jgi:hypothetical protein
MSRVVVKMNRAAEEVFCRMTRLPGFRTLWHKFPLGSVQTRVTFGIFDRPHYAYGVYSAAWLAKRLKLPGISAIELGVAGGDGLIALERIARIVAKDLGIRIAVVGFDSGHGMPKPADYRDLPYVWGEKLYPMDEVRLRARLSPETLLSIGDVRETVPEWLARSDSPPLGFAAFDLDYYSSTLAALRMFDPPSPERTLPRVYCYFDDIIWPLWACHNEFTGQLCAIREFNCEHEFKKLCVDNMLRWMLPHPQAWTEQMYIMHDFHHPLYCTNITPPANGK